MTADEACGQEGAKRAAAEARARVKGWHNVVGATADELRQAELDALVRYADIIDLPAPTSKRHPRQPPEARAAQFSPFAALTGYGEQVRETQRHVESRRELAEDEREVARRTLNEMAALLTHNEQPLVEVTFFVPDPVKDGGSYATIRGRARKIDEYRHVLVVTCEDASGDAATDAPQAGQPSQGQPLAIPLADIWQIALEREGSARAEG